MHSVAMNDKAIEALHRMFESFGQTVDICPAGDQAVIDHWKQEFDSELDKFYDSETPGTWKKKLP